MTPCTERARTAKLRLLRMHYESGVGHIGGNLSCLDALLCLHHDVMAPDDLFVLSKGHAAGALYVTLWTKGLLTDDDLSTFHRDGTRLAAHPASGWHPSIRFSTGSLGHGAGIAAGVAFARQLAGTPGRIFCLLSDGECEEGSVWEALLFSAHRQLGNLVLVVDGNGLQGFGTTSGVASLEPLGDKARAFGLDVAECDGHDAAEMREVLAAWSPRPRFVILRTTKGNGVSFMEDRMEWHYLPMNDAQYRQACDEVSAR